MGQSSSQYWQNIQQLLGVHSMRAAVTLVMQKPGLVHGCAWDQADLLGCSSPTCHPCLSDSMQSQLVCRPKLCSGAWEAARQGSSPPLCWLGQLQRVVNKQDALGGND